LKPAFFVFFFCVGFLTPASVFFSAASLAAGGEVGAGEVCTGEETGTGEVGLDDVVAGEVAVGDILETFRPQLIVQYGVEGSVDRDKGRTRLSRMLEVVRRDVKLRW
jgi:hypothetical protein